MGTAESEKGFRRKEIDMAEERKWGKWDGPEKPEGPGEVGSAKPPSEGEAEGRGRQFMVTCYNCGTHQYVGPDAKWFTCWKCGATSSEVMLA